MLNIYNSREMLESLDNFKKSTVSKLDMMRNTDDGNTITSSITADNFKLQSVNQYNQDPDSCFDRQRKQVQFLETQLGVKRLKHSRNGSWNFKMGRKKANLEMPLILKEIPQ